jgi:metallo-beta-lactamase family protein
MDIQLSFFGAAQNVTGSRYLVETNGSRLLIDCGLYQERELLARNWEPFPVPPESIDAVLLTHAHLDHCGLLPKLVREGFTGPIYCTAPTAEIAGIVLLDSAHLQEEDAEYKRKRHEREGRKGPYPEVPLYTTEDAEAVSPLFSPTTYEKPLRLGDGLEATYHDAGHILGAANIVLRIKQNGDERRILFSGDVGRRDKPILQDPAVIEKADYVVVESTYGDRIHRDRREIDDALADIVNSTKNAGGNIVIPSFAVERSQELLYHLSTLLREKRIPRLPVFVDSPMAIRVTDVFEHHPEYFDEEMMDLIRRKESPFDFPGLRETRTVEQSKQIAKHKGSAIIIAGSGMCTGGRIKYHLIDNVTRKESTILFVGYQAFGTLGRHIVEGTENVRILGQRYDVKARIAEIHGFSAHADRDELLAWLSSLQSAPRHIFVTHGEPEVAESFSRFVQQKTGWPTSVPSYEDSVTLQ